MALTLLFPDASERLYAGPPSIKFYCPCHEGTWFTVTTKANVPYASCPVCGSVCEPLVSPSAGTKNSR